MRVIKKITIVTQQGANSYEIGNVINGLEIKSIVDCSAEYENSLEVGYRCLSSEDGRYVTKNLIVEIWNTPVVAEYMEVPE